MKNIKIRDFDRNTSSLLLLFILTITLLQIGFRSIFNIPFIGVEELSRYLFIAFVFLGLPYNYRTDGHIKLEGIQKYFSKQINIVINLIIHISCILVFLTISLSAFYTTFTNYKSTTPTLLIPFWLFFLPTVLGFTLLTIEHFRKLKISVWE